MDVADLAALLDHPGIRRAAALAEAMPGLSTGFADLDRVIPGGGWPPGGVVELAVPAFGVGEGRLLAPALRRVTADRRWVLFIGAEAVPYAPAWQASGVDLARVVWCRAPNEDEATHACEQALRLGEVGAVLLWVRGRRVPWLRLVAAAERGGGLGFVLREGSGEGAAPIPLRLGVMPHREGLQVQVRKRRGPPLPRPLVLR